MAPSVGHQLQAHAQALRALARDLAGEHHADDLLQETALQALTAPPQRPGPLGGWFASVLRHLASKRHRTERRRQRREQAAARPEALPPADAELLSRDTFRRLGDAVLALPQPYQGVLLRRYLQEQAPREIAAATGVPLATVKSQLQRGLSMLRERLERDGGGDWRPGFGVVFGFGNAAGMVGVASGAILMASGVKLVASGLVAASAVAAVLWFADGAPEALRQPARALEAPAVSPVAPLGSVLPEPAPLAEDTVRRVALPATATWVLQGRAVRAVETPLPGARVLARAFHGTEAKGEPAVEARLVADAEGSFTWPLEPPAGVTCCELRGEGERVRSYPATFVVAPGDPPPPSFDLWIVPLEAVARGCVLDDQDRPVAGARVGSAWQGGVHTDAEGRFEVAVERKPGVTLYASARGFVQLRQEVAIDLGRGEGEAELRLRPANRMHGRVTDAGGLPVAGAVVRTFHTIYADGAETDGDGRYVLDNLDPSLKSHSVFARKPGYVEAKADVEASGPDVEQDLVLQRGVAVRGVVFGPTGRPVPAATVYLGFSPSAYNRLDAVTDADGRFAFDCVPAGEETLNVERRGFAGVRRKVAVPKAPAPAVEVRLDLDAGHFVGGVAKGADGKPVAGVSIAPLLDGEYLDGVRAKTDAEGRFRLDGLPAGGLSLEFYGGGVLRKQEPVPAVDRFDLAVALERHGFMAGTVVDGRTGQPIREFRIRFGQPRLREGEQQGGGYSAQWVRGGKAFHDERGTFRIVEEVQVGAVFALEASAEGFGTLVHDHVVVQPDPDPKALVFELFPGTRIEGFVRERGSLRPVAGARLKAWSAGRPLQPHEPNDDEGRPIAVSDERGAFQLDNVGPGEVSILVEHPDWLPVTHGPVAVAVATPVPAQEVLLDRGVTLTVDVRGADGGPLADAELQIVGSGVDLTGRSDAQGTVRIERVPPGEHELVLVQASGAHRVWAFRRSLRVGHDDCRVEFVASDGDATLVVILEAPEALPDRLQLWCMPAVHGQGPAPSFRARCALVQPDRTVIANLPAMELRVSLICNGWIGSSTVTTRAGETVEVRIPVQKEPPRGGR